jgi:hypothetical protein
LVCSFLSRRFDSEKSLPDHFHVVEEEPPPNTDVVLSGPTDFDAATARILEELKRWGMALEEHFAAPRQCWSRMQLHARNKMRSQATVCGTELGGQFPAFQTVAQE